MDISVLDNCDECGAACSCCYLHQSPSKSLKNLRSENDFEVYSLVHLEFATNKRKKYFSDMESVVP